MGRIFLKRGRWHLDFLDETGRRRRMATEYTAEDEALAKEVLAQAEAGIEVRKRHMDSGGPMTLRAWASRWIAGRKAASGPWFNQEGHLRLHILPTLGDMRLGDIKPRHVIAWLAAMKNTNLSPSRVRNCYSTLKVAFQDAMVAEVVTSSPCVMTKRDLPPPRDKDPAWRATAIFSREEAELLISDERIAEDRRVQYALLFLAGLRFGELAGLQWSDYDPRAEPLGRLSVERSFDQRIRQIKPTKTECPRDVPVHPELAKILAEWKLGGFERYTGRKPQSGDLIMPVNSKCLDHRHARAEWERMTAEFEKLGLRHRRQHDARRTFISLALSGGAPPHILKWVTHGSKASVMDQYTTLPWETLCSAVSCLRLKRREGRVVIAKFASGTTSAPLEMSSDNLSICEPTDHVVRVTVNDTYASSGGSGKDTLDGRRGSQSGTMGPREPAVVPNGAKPSDTVGDTLEQILAEWREKRDLEHLRAGLRKVLRSV